MPDSPLSQISLLWLVATTFRRVISMIGTPTLIRLRPSGPSSSLRKWSLGLARRPSSAMREFGNVIRLYAELLAKCLLMTF